MKNLTFRSNNHRVTMYGRLFFTVTSASRKGLVHFVDLEQSSEWRSPILCTCEAFYYQRQPCRHIDVCIEAIASWAGIDPDRREEWCQRLHFLLEMRVPFMEALVSDSLMALRSLKEPTVRKRKYTLNETSVPANSQRLYAGVHRKPARPSNRKGAKLRRGGNRSSGKRAA